MNYRVGDLVRDKYSRFTGIVRSTHIGGLVKVVSLIPGEFTRIKFLPSGVLLPIGSPYVGSIVRTEYGDGVLMWINKNQASVFLDNGDRVTVDYTSLVVNAFDNEYVDNRFLDIYLQNVVQ